jgi:hypothetical protein
MADSSSYSSLVTSSVLLDGFEEEGFLGSEEVGFEEAEGLAMVDPSDCLIPLEAHYGVST